MDAERLTAEGGVLLDGQLDDHVESLQTQLREAHEDVRVLERDAQLMAYEVLSATPSGEQDVPHEKRLRAVRMGRHIWEKDPQVGRAVKLLTDFVVGGGISRPHAKDEDVQEVLDEVWDDPQNQRILTGTQAQREKIIDLTIQANLFFLLFDDGDDGKVKVGMLEHDTVTGVIRDPNNRHRILYFVTKERVQPKWNFHTDAPEAVAQAARTVYYEVVGALEEAEEEGGTEKLPKPPRDKLGEGKVYHVAINKTSEMALGFPEMARIVNWASAFREYAAARVDVAKIASSILMRRHVKGGRRAVDSIARQRLTRRSDLTMRQDAEDPDVGPKPGSALVENEGVETSPFTINPQGSAATSDAEMLRSQIASGTGFPSNYFGGDPGSLAGATSLELPTMAMIRALQRLVEGIFRWLFDRAIERAVEHGRLEPGGDSRTLREYEDRVQDEQDTERDLSYKFHMPNPVKRQMGELVTAVGTVARTFDPNGVNMELTRRLLSIVLSEAFEVEDPAAEIEVIFPDGYNPVAELQKMAAEGQPQPPAGGEQPYGQEPGQELERPVGADGQRHGADNPYGAPQRATPPERVQEAAVPWRNRNGELMGHVPIPARKALRERNDEVADEVDEAFAALERALPHSNGR